MEIGVRPANLESRDERSFIADAFVRSVCSSRRYDQKSNGIAMDFWRKVFDFLAHRAEILIAVREDDPTRFVGYAIYQNKGSGNKTCMVHYIYVKYDYRCRGYASQMLGFVSSNMDDTPVFTVHTAAMTHMADKWGVVVDESKLYEQYYEELLHG